MLMMSRQDRDRLGLSQVLEALICFSPQGRRLKGALQAFGPREREALEAEFSAIEKLADQARRHPDQVTEVQGLLGQLRDIRSSLQGLQKGRLLDLTELFEIKEATRLIRLLADKKPLLDKADIKLTPFPDLENILNPRGQERSGFYIYDDYSKKLADLRLQRAGLEKKLEKVEGQTRETLLYERARLVDEEEKEEGTVRKSICQQIKAWAPDLEEALDRAGLLDFRLAKALLALEWGSRRPSLLEEGETAILEAFFHPQIEGHLRNRGADYERQTLALPRGTTVLSGPNMGGKSVALKALTLAMVLVHLGYFPPAAFMATPLFDFISYSSDHFDTTRKGLSSFASEIIRLRDQAERSKIERGFVVLDEPCRGTNPREATGLVGALARFYARGEGVLVMASHYLVAGGSHIQKLRIRGIMEEALEEVMEKESGLIGDEEAVRRIESLMDYGIERAREEEEEGGAIRLASWLGLDPQMIEDAKEEMIWAE